MFNNNDMYYIYLFALQESGVTNMFGAATYLVETFDVPNAEALTILAEWMKNYEALRERLIVPALKEKPVIN